ncbi:cytochrome c oxidase subunit 3 [Brucella melitensis]|uniref:cytochrome c oxidase subunit 3 n=1 Tax=Brucella melitensis TaxID=29459 RepID=UPI000D9BEA34|nr:cytochrome c oxidase subunit 3 [Brucella melitensis]SPU61332.1 cytochrome c oxidase polypeptide III [Brucella melitensis]
MNISTPPFAFKDSIYGEPSSWRPDSHGFHVLIGHDLPASSASSCNRRGFHAEAAISALRLPPGIGTSLDVVWLFLFFAIYVWGGWGAPMHGG